VTHRNSYSTHMTLLVSTDAYYGAIATTMLLLGSIAEAVQQLGQQQYRRLACTCQQAAQPPCP
jgi:hypothetical protein